MKYRFELLLLIGIVFTVIFKRVYNPFVPDSFSTYGILIFQLMAILKTHSAQQSAMVLPLLSLLAVALKLIFSMPSVNNTTPLDPE